MTVFGGDESRKQGRREPGAMEALLLSRLSSRIVAVWHISNIAIRPMYSAGMLASGMHHSAHWRHQLMLDLGNTFKNRDCTTISTFLLLQILTQRLFFRPPKWWFPQTGNEICAEFIILVLFLNTARTIKIIYVCNDYPIPPGAALFPAYLLLISNIAVRPTYSAGALPRWHPGYTATCGLYLLLMSNIAVRLTYSAGRVGIRDAPRLYSLHSLVIIIAIYSFRLSMDCSLSIIGQ